MDTQSRVARLLLIGCLTVGGVLAQDDAIDKDLADKIAEVKLRRDDAKPVRSNGPRPDPRPRRLPSPILAQVLSPPPWPGPTPRPRRRSSA